MKNIFIAFIVCLLASCSEKEAINVKPVAAFKTNALVIQEGQILTVTDLSFDQDGEIVKWLWDFGNGLASELKSPENIVYNTPGEYSITLSVWDEKGIQNANLFSKNIVVKERSLSDVVPDILWEYTATSGFQDISPAIDSNGNVIIGCDAKTGRGVYNILVVNKGVEKWRYASGDVVRSSPAIADNGIMYIGSYDKKLYAFTAASPEPLGTFNLGVSAKYSSPAIDKDGTVYFSANKKLMAITAAPEMKLKWSGDCENTTQSTPIIGTNAVYVCSNSGKLYAFSKDGMLLWKVDYGKTCSAVSAMDEDETIYLCGETDEGGVVMAVQADGIVKWKQNTTAKFANSGISLSAKGQLYVGNSSGELVCYNQNNGEKLWTFNAKGQIRSVPAIDNGGNIYFGDAQGFFYVLNAQGKSLYKELKLGSNIWSSPLIDENGIIYICSDGDSPTVPGKLYALQTTATGVQGSWAMRSGDSRRSARKMK